MQIIRIGLQEEEKEFQIFEIKKGIFNQISIFDPFDQFTSRLKLGDLFYFRISPNENDIVGTVHAMCRGNINIDELSDTDSEGEEEYIFQRIDRNVNIIKIKTILSIQLDDHIFNQLNGINNIYINLYKLD
jgi:hypothetical protein